jgi:predicted dehydrogenase
MRTSHQKVNQTRPIRLGVIGCGNVLEAYVRQCAKLQALGLAELVIGCGREHQRERALGLGVPRFTTSANEVLNSEVDVVIVLASMNEHAHLASDALRADKHVLIEKPLATNMPDARSLVELAKQRERYLFCSPFTMLSPTFQNISARIKRGDIGKPCLARARYGWAGPDWSEWFYKPGGGCLFDLGVYCIASLTGLLGPVERVMAMTGVAIPEREINGRKVRVEVEDNAQVLLNFGDNMFGVVTCGFTMQQYRSPALEVYGTTGTIQMAGDDWDPDGYELWQNDLGAWQIFKETTPDWPWSDGLRHLVECLVRDERPLVTIEHALHVLEIMLGAQQSGREGRTVAIKSSFSPQQFSISKAGEPAHLQHDRTREHFEPLTGGRGKK